MLARQKTENTCVRAERKEQHPRQTASTAQAAGKAAAEYTGLVANPEPN
jgi:hypothetical protein